MNFSTVDESRLKTLSGVFMDWNQRLNLSAIREPEAIWEKHILDSVLPMDLLEFSNKKCLDIGSGGGFPVLPLAILCPEASFVALDSVGKKMKAVASIAEEMEIGNLKTYHGRIEDFGQDRKFREEFDIVTARALAPWPVLLEYALPFVRVGGFFLAYQGPGIESDLESFLGLEKKLGGSIEKIEKRLLGDQSRIFILIKKIVQTSNRYPRSNGVPRKEPLA